MGKHSLFLQAPTLIFKSAGEGTVLSSFPTAIMSGPSGLIKMELRRLIFLQIFQHELAEGDCQHPRW